MEPHVGVCWWEGDHLDRPHLYPGSVWHSRGDRACIRNAARARPGHLSFPGRRLRLQGAALVPVAAVDYPCCSSHRSPGPLRVHPRAAVHTSRPPVRQRAGPDSRGGRDWATAGNRASHPGADVHPCRVMPIRSAWCRSGSTDASTSPRSTVWSRPTSRTRFPMRGPGEAPGSFALESAMDELAEKLAIDPIVLRLMNIADHDQVTGLPWSSNGLAKCLRQGAAAFGWHDRDEHGWRRGAVVGGSRPRRGVLPSPPPAPARSACGWMGAVACWWSAGRRTWARAPTPLSARWPPRRSASQSIE